jgi:hypothetical protein
VDQRAGVLLGDGDLQAEDNPFGTAVIADAYKHALKQTEGPIEVRMKLLMLWDGATFDALDDAYHALNDMLVENSILPKIRYGIARQESKAAAGTPGTPAPGAEGADAAGAPKTPEDMFAALSQMLNAGAAAGGAAGGGAPGGGLPGMGVGGIPQVMGAELMSSLSNLQMGNLAALGEAAAELGPILAEVGNLKNVLHQIKGTSVGASMGQVDATTLDIVARMFDELFDDPKVPIALKGLIGRLQLPFLKVAIADKELFTRKTHPARLMLDTLGQIGLRLPSEWDDQTALFPRMESNVQRVVDGYQESVEIFDEVRADLEQVLAEDDARVAKEMEAEQEKLRRAESLALAKSVAQEEISKRVQSAAAAPRPVVEFLVKEWIKYLVVVIARDGAESALAKSALETIDQLLWSVAPKASPEERR